MLQVSALLFRTTTSIEMKYGIETIERAARSVLHVSQEPRFAPSVALFIGFIPEVFELWQKLDMAWRARGGKSAGN
jgi:energy-coupling factor transporter transmembrane protein EcfT